MGRGCEAAPMGRGCEAAPTGRGCEAAPTGLFFKVAKVYDLSRRFKALDALDRSAAFSKSAFFIASSCVLRFRWWDTFSAKVFGLRFVLMADLLSYFKQRFIKKTVS